MRAKFDRLKEEVNSDLGVFAGDLVGILEKSAESNPEWKEILEDLLIIARQCAMMSSSEFWIKCEAIVQNLDDRRQELPTGALKQAHTRMLFILTRCTRLVQFQKESGFDDYDLGHQQLYDMGVYPEQLMETAERDSSQPLSKDESEKVTQQGYIHPEIKEVYEKQGKKSYLQLQTSATLKEELENQHEINEVDCLEVNTARSVDSSSSSIRMSSWKRLPSRNRKNLDNIETPSKDKADRLCVKDEAKLDLDDSADNPYTPVCHLESSGASLRAQKIHSGFWGEHHHVTCENLMICRICEVEIPTVHVEEHSRICTMADRCDLKGLSVNERLERVVETLEKILQSWTPKSTPKCIDIPRDSQEAITGTASIQEYLDEKSPEQSSLQYECSEEMLDCEPSPGSLTPRSPLITPQYNHSEFLLSGRKAISELENYDQVCFMHMHSRVCLSVHVMCTFECVF